MALERNATVTHLDLSGSYCGDQGATALAGLLKSKRTNVRKLGLGGAYERHHKLGAMGMEAVRQLKRAKMNKKLLGSKKGGTGIDAEEAAKLDAALRDITRLTSIGVSSRYPYGTHVTDIGAAAIAQALEVNSSLAELSLTHQLVTARGVTRFLHVITGGVGDASGGGSASSGGRGGSGDGTDVLGVGCPAASGGKTQTQRGGGSGRGPGRGGGGVSNSTLMYLDTRGNDIDKDSECEERIAACLCERRRLLRPVPNTPRGTNEHAWKTK